MTTLGDLYDRVGFGVNLVVVAGRVLGVGLEECGDGRWRGRCPFHDDENPSFEVFVGDDGQMRGGCWVCPHLGPAMLPVDLVAAARDVDPDEAARLVTEATDGADPPPAPTTPRPTPADVAAEVARAVERPGAVALLAALVRHRGWPDAPPPGWVVDEFGLGATVDEDGLVIPHRRTDGAVTAAKRRCGLPDPAGRRWSSRSVYGSRLDALYGEWRDRGRRRVVVVEGESDTWHVAYWLRDEPVDVLGLPSGAGPPKRGWLDRLAGREVTVLFDADDAGRAAAREWETEGGAMVAELPDGLDVAEAGEAAARAALAATDDRVGEDPEYTETLRRERLRVRAREEVRAERAAAGFEPPPSFPSLAEELALDEPPPAFVVDGLLPEDGNALLAAAYKAGKTTLLVNLLRALVDGHPFLGNFGVGAPQRVALWNYEMGDRQMRAWLREADVANAGRGALLNLRGRSVPLLSPVGRDFAVDWLAERAVDVWLVDPFGRTFSGAGGENENDNAEVRRFLDVLEEVKRRAGVGALVVATHLGRMEHAEGAERARGATVLDDWADARWLLVRDEGVRYLRAEGRDVDVPETRLDYDPTARRLDVAGGSRRDARLREVVDLVLADHGVKKGDLRARMTGRNDQRDELIKEAIRRGLVRVERNDRGHLCHYPGDLDGGAE